MKSNIPLHFSRCGANRADATGRSQFGHKKSIGFLVAVEPKISKPGRSITGYLIDYYVEEYLIACTSSSGYEMKRIFTLYDLQVGQ